MKRTLFLTLTFIFLILLCSIEISANEPDLQPPAAQATRVVEAMEHLGAPLPPAARNALAEAKDVGQIEAVLDRYCLVLVNIASCRCIAGMRGSARGS